MLSPSGVHCAVSVVQWEIDHVKRPSMVRRNELNIGLG